MRGASSREFTDSVGVAWTVVRVEPQALSPTLERIQRNTAARLGDTEERRQPWLVFHSADGEKRRLVPVPQDWLTCSAYEIERWCMRAVLVPPAPARREQDQVE